MIHRMIDWEGDPVAGYGDIVCGVIRTPDTECSMFASGYDCPDCRLQTPPRQRVAQVARLLTDVRQHGPRGGKAERYLQMLMTACWRTATRSERKYSCLTEV